MKYININVILPKQVGILAEMVIELFFKLVAIPPQKWYMPESPLNRELLIHI